MGNKLTKDEAKEYAEGCYALFNDLQCGMCVTNNGANIIGSQAELLTLTTMLIQHLVSLGIEPDAFDLVCKYGKMGEVSHSELYEAMKEDIASDVLEQVNELRKEEEKDE